MYESRIHKAVILDVNPDGTYNILDVAIRAVKRDVGVLSAAGIVGGVVTAYAERDTVLIAYVDGSYYEPVILGAYTKKVPTPLNDIPIADCTQLDFGPTQVQVSNQGITVLHKEVSLNLTEQGVEATTPQGRLLLSEDAFEVNANGQVYKFTKDRLAIAEATDTAALTAKVVDVLTQIHTILTSMSSGVFVPADAAAVSAVAAQVQALLPKLSNSYLGSQKLSLL